MKGGKQPLLPAFEDCQRSVKVFGGSTTFTAGGSWQISVPVDALTERIDLRLDLSVVIGSSPTGYVVHTHNAAEMLPKIELSPGSLGIKKSFRGLDAWLLAGARDRVMPHIDSLTTAESNAAATYPVSVVIPIHLASYGVAPQFLGTLVAKSQHQILLTGTFGTSASMVHTGSGGTWAATGTLRAYRHNIHPTHYDAGGYGHLVETTQDLDIATTGEKEVTLPAWRRHRSLLMVCKTGTVPVLSDAVLSALRIRYEASTNIYDMNDEDIRAMMFSKYGVPTTLASGAAMDWTGVYLLEYGKHMPGIPGSLLSYLDAREASQLTALPTATAGTSTQIHFCHSIWED